MKGKVCRLLVAGQSNTFVTQFRVWTEVANEFITFVRALLTSKMSRT